MAAVAVVEALQVLEDRRPGVLACRPAGAVEQFGLERGEEALGGGVVPAGARPADAGACAMLGQDGRCTRRSGTDCRGPSGGSGRRLVVGVVSAMCSASVASSVRRWSASAQPTTRRLNASRMTARYSQPSQVRT